MPTFKTLTYKNLQSVGNHPITIDLNSASTTLIGGANGSGKSVVLYAFAYCLFGKFLSGMKLAEAINSVNQKNLETCVTFESNGHEYKVIRGEKPKKFQIFCDDEQLDKEASASDHQKRLEIILGMDYTLFTQIIVLNKERYKPIMSMSAGDRRKIIEDILGINIFSYMNDEVKERLKESKRIQSNHSKNREVKQTELQGQQKLISQIQSSIEESQAETQQEIDRLERENEEYDKQIEKLDQERQQLTFSIPERQPIADRINEFNGLSSSFSTEQKQLKERQRFYRENDNCPTCEQPFAGDMKERRLNEVDERLNTIASTSNELIDELQKAQKQLKIIDESIDELRNKEAELNRVVSQRDSNRKHIKSLSEKGNKAADGSKYDEAVQTYYSIEKQLTEATQALEDEIAHHDKLERFREGLKDEGIKANIIQEYIPLLNRKINEYLRSMEFYINMELDENFKVSFHAMNKENFTLSNLSTGQKTRVNLAVWLSILEVASIKNSVVSNVLLLDEILENLDSDGVAQFMELCRDKLSDKNLFIISQRFDEFKDYFADSIQFERGDHGFTEMIRSDD